MVPFALPLAIILLGGTAYFVAKKSGSGNMTAERKIVYQTALRKEKDPAKLRALAEEYRAQGLTAQADLLDKRAALRELPPDVKAARRTAFKAALASTNKGAILAMANALDNEGATGAADKLREYAGGLS